MNIDSLTVEELKNRLRAAGCKLGGNKEELRQRLRETMSASSSSDDDCKFNDDDCKFNDDDDQLDDCETKENTDIIIPKVSYTLKKITRKFCGDSYTFSIVDGMKIHDYQYDYVEKMIDLEMKRYNDLNFKGGILLGIPGVGKTLIGLLFALISRQKNNSNRPAIIVAEKPSVWVKELLGFFGSSINYRVYTPDIHDETSGNDIKDLDLIITTYSCVEYNFKTSELYNKNRKNQNVQRRNFSEDLTKTSRNVFYYTNWDRILFDESHKLKNNMNIVNYACTAMYSQCKWGLTGTISAGKMADIMNQFVALGLELNGAKINDNSYNIFKLDRKIIRLTYEDANIVLPPWRIERVDIEMSKEEREVYSNIRKWVKMSNNGNIDNLDNGSIFSYLQRCLQVSISPALLSNEFGSEKIFEKLPPFIQQNITEMKNKYGTKSSKVETCVSLVKKHKDRKIIVFSNYVGALKLASIALADAGIKSLMIYGDLNTEQRLAVEHAFNTDPSYQVLLASKRLASQSYNFQVASIEIFLNCWWCPIVMEQAFRRIVRPGQTNDVIIYLLNCIDTVDMHIEKVLVRKEDSIESLFNGSSMRKNIETKQKKRLLFELEMNRSD